MSDFYAINDPAHQDKIKHQEKYLLIDDWGNIFLATYDNALDMFWAEINSDDNKIVMRYFMDEGCYYADKLDSIDIGGGNKISRKSIVKGNRILKFRPFDLETEGYKFT